MATENQDKIAYARLVPISPAPQSTPLLKYRLNYILPATEISRWSYAYTMATPCWLSFTTQFLRSIAFWLHGEHCKYDLEKWEWLLEHEVDAVVS